jgi:O-antigen/teichoic acid export membrane protein
VTDPDRGDRRPPRPASRLGFGLVLNGASRALLVATPAVTLPMITDGLGKTNYGAYAVIITVAVFVSWADFGITLSMITAVSQASGRRDDHAVRTIVSTGLVTVLTVGGTVAALAPLVAFVVDWRSVLGLTDRSVTADVSLAVLCVLLSVAIGIPAQFGMKVMLALQMNRAFASWQAAVVPAVILVVGVGHVTSAGVPWFVVATMGTPHVVAAVSALWLFLVARPDIAPHVSLAVRRTARGLFELGAAFTVNSIAAAVGYSTSSIVVSRVVGVDEVAVFNISDKLSMIGFLVFESLLLPLWPAFGAALAAGEYAATRARLRRAVSLSAALGLAASATFVLAAPTVIGSWLGPAFAPSLGLLVALAVRAAIQFASQPFVLVLNGAGVKRFLLVSSLLVAGTTLPLSILLTHAAGVSGPPWAFAISTTLFVLVPSAYYANRHIARLETQNAAQFTASRRPVALGRSRSGDQRPERPTTSAAP